MTATLSPDTSRYDDDRTPLNHYVGSYARDRLADACQTLTTAEDTYRAVMYSHDATHDERSHARYRYETAVAEFRGRVMSWSSLPLPF